MKKIFSLFAAMLFAGSMMAGNATMAAGTNASAAKVNEKDAIKCGTAKAAGDMTITVGATATTLSFYAAAWNNETETSITITAPAGVTVSPASADLTSDSGIAGNSPFTLNGTEADYKIEVTLSGVSAQTKLTIASEKRFVVWGAETDGEGGGDDPGQGGDDPELTDPTNCAEAREAALSVSGNNVEYNGGKEYTIEGYVTAIQEAWNSNFNNLTFWMADAKDGGKVLEAYRAKRADGEDGIPGVGDKVEVTGKLTKYGSTPEFAQGCTFKILEKDEPAVNLGEKSIAEFLELKNVKDTCVLTGVVANIKMDGEEYNQYGNFDLVDENDSEVKVYIYGLLTADGKNKQFREMGIDEGDILTLKAVYAEHNGEPQAANAIYVSHEKSQGTGISNTAVEVKAQKVIRDGQIYIVKDGQMFNLVGAAVK